MRILFAAALTRVALVSIIAAGLWAAPVRAADTDGPQSFATLPAAIDALVTATQADDVPALQRLFGPAFHNLVISGDPIADSGLHRRFIASFQERAVIVRDGDAKAVLITGRAKVPFPIPLVRKSGQWQFNADVGGPNVVMGRIALNEINAIETCRSYVRAQRAYAADSRAGPEGRQYAQHLISSAGTHDGLFWPVLPGEKESPNGAQMTRAEADGYGTPNEIRDAPVAPYNGYYYRILTSQGAAAAGGAANYIVDGQMTGGFALLAFPAVYGDSGVTTFVVNQDGLVYEVDYGKDTDRIARQLKVFNPDNTWVLQSNFRE